MTWTSSSLAIAVVALLLVPLASAPHESGGRITDGGLDFNSEFDLPRYDSNAQIAVYFFFPFIFITVFYKIIFDLLFNRVVDSGSGRSYSFQTSLMAVSATSLMVPSPAWDYVILVINSIALLGVATVFLVLLLILVWTLQGGREDPIP